jgi:lipopolysaccharide transport system ATP-binding protein
MSSPIIEVKGISKCYQLGTIGATRLRDDLERAWHRLTGKAEKPDEREFWALRDVSFEVQPGEIVGIIGRNGAGKSTLLKILSRITEPSSGEIVLRGRVASLLEVGTGFVGDLSGRENVFLNGAILGMTKAEIRSKFDEIVAFAEIDQFIDTPVKRYSSGMYVRLAFAVAAHLEPEILIVDEVLAVGDAQFQKKCLGKMKNVSEREGRTVLFVSHNMAAVKTLCTRGILLGGGSVLTSGETAKVVGEHLRESLSGNRSVAWLDLSEAPGENGIKLMGVAVRPPDGEDAITVDSGSVLQIKFFNEIKHINLDCTVYLINADGIMLFESGCIVSSNNDSNMGHYHIACHIPPHLLNAGSYYINILFGKDQRYVLFKQEEVIAFEVENTTTGRGLNMSAAPGVIRPLLQWKMNFF